jgi:hypothetical protein
MKKWHKKGVRIVWLVVSIFAVLGMIAFTLLPLIYAY